MKKPRGVFVAGNWKMNHGPAEAERFFSAVKAAWEKSLGEATRSALRTGTLKAAVCAPYVSLHAALRAAQGTPIAVGAQNAHWEKSGAFTGEISGGMLREIGIDTVLTGHSERRQYFGETDETVRKRTESLLEQGLRVIACIGETRAEREGGQTAAVLERQLSALFPTAGQGAAKFLGAEAASRAGGGSLVIAYEPVWAIGTGLTATPAQAEEAHQIVRKFLWDRCGMEASGRTPILYGGSVTPENIRALLECPNIDGALVGGASLKPEPFLALVQAGGEAA